MLTLETLNANETLAALPEATRQLIAEMSQRDEDNVIGAKIGELHGRYDADVLNASSIAKKDGEKSYDYVKRVIGELVNANKNNEYKTKYETATAKITELEEKLAKNGDEETRRMLKDAKDQITRLQAESARAKTEHEKALADANNLMRDTKLGFAFDLAVAKLKFKDSVTSAMQKALLTAARAEVMGKGTPEIREDGSIVFRDKDNKLLLNPANGSNPFTLSELVESSESLKDAIDRGRNKTGSGTGADSEHDSENATLDISAAKTRVEADEIITQYLFSKGMTMGPEFVAEKSKLRKDLGVDKLPLK